MCDTGEMGLVPAQLKLSISTDSFKVFSFAERRKMLVCQKWQQKR